MNIYVIASTPLAAANNRVASSRNVSTMMSRHNAMNCFHDQNRSTSKLSLPATCMNVVCRAKGQAAISLEQFNFSIQATNSTPTTCKIRDRFQLLETFPKTLPALTLKTMHIHV